MLALMLLTFLGLTLTMTTSTELQIATNYRWSQQAYYNARPESSWASATCGRSSGAWCCRRPWRVSDGPCVNFGDAGLPAVAAEPQRRLGRAQPQPREQACDGDGAQGFGVVFDNPTFASPFQNTSSFFGQALTGSFTVWVRRPLVWLVAIPATNSKYVDNPANDLLILTARHGALPGGERDGGLEPGDPHPRGAVAARRPAECENYTGQAGSGPGGVTSTRAPP